MHVSSQGRIPRAHIDPIESAADAMAVFSLQMSRPLCHETLVMFLDHARCGSTLVTVTDTDEPDAIIDIVEAMALSGHLSDSIVGLVVLTVRPDGGVQSDDDGRWLEAADVVDQCGLELIDWLVVGRDGVHSPRAELNLPSRWPGGR